MKEKVGSFIQLSMQARLKIWLKTKNYKNGANRTKAIEQRDITQRYRLLRVSIHGDFLRLTTDFFISLSAVSSCCFTAGCRLVFFDSGIFVTVSDRLAFASAVGRSLSPLLTICALVSAISTTQWR